MKKFLLALFSALILVACNQADKDSIHDLMAEEGGFQQLNSIEMLEEETTRSSSDNANTATLELPQLRKMIWTANLRFQVNNVDASTDAVQALCKKHEGFISNMSLVSNNYELSNSIEIRVHNDHFNELISAFKEEATYVDEFSVQSQDVTEEYVDIESRLKTKREVRDRYIEVLRNKATNVEDILAAEEAIRVITEEIEAKEGRLRYLNDQVNFSTIRLTIYEKVEYSESPLAYEKPYSTELSDGFADGWSVVTGFLVALVTIWPILLLGILFWWKGMWLWRKLFGKSN